MCWPALKPGVSGLFLGIAFGNGISQTHIRTGPITSQDLIRAVISEWVALVIGGRAPLVILVRDLLRPHSATI